MTTNVPSEHEEQVVLFKWALANARCYIGLSMMFAIPNGGLRNIITARKLKAEGVKAGIPDIFLPIARGMYHGLFIEMKRQGALPSSVKLKQEHMHIALGDLGYRVVVSRGWKEASELILQYYKLGCHIGDK